jgi:hypothetical protein
MICPNQTALTHPTAAMHHIMARDIVIRLPTHKIPSLANSLPIIMVAKVKPTFGKMKAHQVREKGMLPATARLPRKAMANAQKVKIQRNTPRESDRICKISLAEGCTEKYPYEGETGIALAWPMKATIVYEQPPIGMNKAGRD